MAIVALIGIGLSLLLFQLVQGAASERERYRFDSHADMVLEEIALSLGTALESLHALGQLYASSEEVTRQEFATFTGPALDRNRSIEGVAWLPRVRRGERAAFEDRARAQGNPEFDITERDGQGNLVAAEARDVYFPVFYWQPDVGNYRVLGLDAASNPATLPALEDARDTGEIRLIPPIALVQRTKEFPYGFGAVLPVYRHGAALATVADRRENLVGFVAGVFRIGNIVESARKHAVSGAIELFLFDVSAAPGEQRLYPDSPAVEWLEDIASPFRVSRTFEFGGRQWLGVVVPHGEHRRLATLVLPWMVLAVGLLCTGLLTYAIHMGRKRTAEAQRVAERDLRLQSIMDNVVDAIVVIDAKGIVETANVSAQRLFGYAESELAGHNVSMMMPEPDRSRHDGYIADYVRTGKGKILGIGPREVTGVHKNGHKVDLELAVSEMQLGAEVKFIGVLRDITERKKTADRLRRTAERLQLATESAGIGIWEWNIATNEFIWNDRLCEIRGIRPEEFDGSEAVRRQTIHPQDLHRADAELAEVLAGSGNQYHATFRIVRPDGESRHIEGYALVQRDAAGVAVRMTGINLDITDQVEMTQRLQQSQKMEAVGQLTGGIAHDFNNLLAVILGNLDMMEEDIDPASDTRALLEVALKATLRGAELTQRLLAFSRQQALDPTVTNVNAIVPGMNELLRRTLGEQVEIESVLASGLWQTMVDAGQFENAMLNLAINARDAMPEGGKLTIETANARLDHEYAAGHDEVTPGQYVMVSVTDTGTGMSPEVAARAFEPFFTTKEVGKGSGLGLSMIFGFVKQSGGHIKIYSEPGHGTTIRMYLPKATANYGRKERALPAQLASQPGGDETILVVEDDPDVRGFLVAALGVLGYRIVAAEDGPAALALLDGLAQLDMVLTDVVMPKGMNGQQVAAAVRQRFPRVKVLYTSGYTANAIVHQGRLDEDVELLSKPYTRAILAQTVRRVLDAPHG